MPYSVLDSLVFGSAELDDVVVPAFLNGAGSHISQDFLLSLISELLEGHQHKFENPELLNLQDPKLVEDLPPLPVTYGVEELVY